MSLCGAVDKGGRVHVFDLFTKISPTKITVVETPPTTHPETEYLPLFAFFESQEEFPKNLQAN